MPLLVLAAFRLRFMASISLDRVSKRFPGSVVAAAEVSLELADQECIALVGESGSGKSTLLRMIAGLETPDSGQIRIDERDVTRSPARGRNVAMVFQDDALYPHMSVYDNLAFGLKIANNVGVLSNGLIPVFQSTRWWNFGSARRQIDEKVRQAAQASGIEHLLDRQPQQLSGGERQCVAIGRALVRDPAAFLLDEPFSSLDTALRQQFVQDLKRMRQETGATMIYVTHDASEAMLLGDRVAVMRDGKILQVGTPETVYRRPVNLFVASFMGRQPLGVRHGTIEQAETGRFRFTAGRWSFEFDSDGCNEFLDRELAAIAGSQRNAAMGMRYEDVKLERESVAEFGSAEFAGVVGDVQWLGDHAVIEVLESEPGERNAGGQAARGLIAKADRDCHWQRGDRVFARVSVASMHWFDTETEQRLGLMESGSVSR